MFQGGIFSSPEMCGARHESQMDDCAEEIKSKDIVSFSYVGPDFVVSAKKEGKNLHVYASGGGKYNKRDGSYFIIKYDTEDMSLLTKLQEIIDKYGEVRGNGHCVHVDGLPPGIGDTLNVEYESGEKIYKYSNQFPTVRPETTKEFYDTFHEFVIKDGYDFTSAGSNVKLFDDADPEYLQGTWKGKHFGSEVEVTFTGNKVTIKVDGKVTDEDVEYTIFEGSVVKNKLAEGKDGTSKGDYEKFEGVQSFCKKNYFTLSGYFTTESYSTCDLMNFDKEKPKDEE